MATDRNDPDDTPDSNETLDPDAPEQLAPKHKGDDGNILDDIILPDSPDASVPF